MSFSSNFGSVDSLTVLTRCGLRPRADQIRYTVAGLTPRALPIVRQLQCVWPGGTVSCVARDLGDLLLGDGELAPPPRGDRTELDQTLLGKPIPSRHHRRRRNPHLRGDARVRQALPGKQQRPRPLHLPMRRGMRPAQALQNLTLAVRQRHQRGSWTHSPSYRNTLLIQRHYTANSETLHANSETLH
jgi:hypothetical protein